MKKAIILIIIIFSLSSCILLPENPSTPFPSLETQIVDTLAPTATAEQIHETSILTATLTPTKTSIPTSLPTSTNTPQFTETPFPIKLQSGSPKYIKNYAHLSDGCEWVGVAGQVFDKDGKPLLNSVVMVYGKIDGKTIKNVGVTGVPGADIYGPGGFEIKISDNIFASEKLISIQVFDLKGISISDAVSFDTYADCAKNLVIINFQYQE